MIDKEFVPYQESFELKELGFDEPCFGFYGGLNPLGDRYYYTSSGYNRNSDIGSSKNFHCTRVLYQQAFRWFREKYKGVHEIIRKEDCNYLEFMGWIYIDNKKINVNSYWSPLSYEEAELACLRKLIEIVKNK